MHKTVTWRMRLVFNMRINGYRFVDIGRHIGTTRQNAHQQFWSYVRIRQRELAAEIARLDRLRTAYQMAIDGIRELIALASR